MSLHNALGNIKSDFESAISTSTFNGHSYENGAKAKTALIRSQRIINHIHEHIKEEFINCGVNPIRIKPPLGQSLCAALAFVPMYNYFNQRFGHDCLGKA